nr:tetratricopeptide repeat protein [uncultured Brevundimonas sp.]
MTMLVLGAASAATDPVVTGSRDAILADIQAATVARESGRLDDAFAAAERAIASARAVQPADPVLLSDALVARCDAMANRPQPDIADCLEALSLREGALQTDDPKLHNLRIQIAVHKIMNGKAAEAQTDIEAALAGLRRSPTTPAMRTDIGMGVAVLGMAQQAQDRRRDAENSYRAAIAELAQADETGQRYRPLVYNYLNTLLLNEGRLIEALEESERSVEIQRAAAPRGDPTLIGALRALAAAQQRAGRLADAERTLREQLALLDDQQSPQPSLKANALSGLGSLYIDMGRPDLARPLLDQAVATYREGGEAGLRSATTAQGYLAELDLSSGDAATAVARLEAALNDLGLEVSGQQGRAALLSQLARAREEAGDPAGAERDAAAALEIYTRIAPTAPATSGPLIILARADLREGRLDQARERLDAAVAVARARPASAPSRIAAETARIDLALSQPGPLAADLTTLADEAAQGAQDLVLTSARAGMPAQGLTTTTRGAFVNRIETAWRREAATPSADQR